MRSKKIKFSLAGISIIGIFTIFIISQAIGTPATTISIPEPYIAMPGSDLSDVEYEFSDKIAFPDVKTVSVYTMEVQPLEQQLEQISGLEQVSGVNGRIITDEDYIDSSDNYNYYLLEDLELTVMVNESTGYWAALNNDSQDDVLSIPNNLPSDEEAIQIATKYIEENGLFYGELGEPIIYYSTTGGDMYHETQVIAKRVCFMPPIDGKEVYGLYRIAILIEDNGLVTDVFKQVNPVKSIGTVELKTEDEVVQEVLENSESLSSSADGITLGRIVNCELAYYVDGEAVDGEAYIYPVYVLTGVGETDDTLSVQSRSSSTYTSTESNEFDIIIDAVKR